MKLQTLVLLILLIPGFAVAAERLPERPLIPGKSEIGFTVTQMGVGVNGNFKRFRAMLRLDPAKPENGAAEIEVDIASISTGEPDADTEAVTKPWLDAASFPKATFKSSAVRALGGERYEVTGLLSLKGKPRKLTVPFTLKRQPDGTSVATGKFVLRRTDFGIGGGEWNKDDIVANEVPVHFRLTLGAPR
jgi:polyisoprenoid-binding protein YceI